VQVIVVDDGSTDRTAAVARGFDNALLIRQSNCGLAAARNRGLRAATGDYLIFLDADDRLLPGAIDAGVRALAARPACAMAYGRCVMMGPDGEFWPTPDVATVRSGHHAALLQTNLIWTPAIAIFRRDAVVQAGGFAPGFDAAADYDLYLRVSLDAPIDDHGQLVAAYRRHGASMSRGAARMLRDTLAVMRHNCPGDHSELRRAWGEGYARWQDFYGTQLVEEIRGQLRAREIHDAARQAMVLAALAPRVFVRELARKARVLYAGRAIPAAEIPAASRRAET
jgi:glycosyltransferase involved in cell wall biosynthesis